MAGNTAVHISDFILFVLLLGFHVVVSFALFAHGL